MLLYSGYHLRSNLAVSAWSACPYSTLYPKTRNVFFSESCSMRPPPQGSTCKTSGGNLVQNVREGQGVAGSTQKLSSAVAVLSMVQAPVLAQALKAEGMISMTKTSRTMQDNELDCPCNILQPPKLAGSDCGLAGKLAQQMPDQSSAWHTRSCPEAYDMLPCSDILTWTTPHELAAAAFVG